ncbi:MAG: hypothetical protein HY796_13090, partial [Elusimicrobia bacterium]|nr:hypothetical protein [Elusimicrobiota bacterium]
MTMPQMTVLQALDAFLKKWFSRLKIFSFLAATWAVFFAVFTLLGLRAGFEYDDGLAFSTPAFQSARKERAGALSQEYWSSANRSYKLERTKPAVWLSAWFFKAFGFRIDIFCQRDPAGSDALVRSWKPLADNFYFTPEEDQKYQLLENKRFVLYFASSDG